MLLLAKSPKITTSGIEEWTKFSLTLPEKCAQAIIASMHLGIDEFPHLFLDEETTVIHHLSIQSFTVPTIPGRTQIHQLSGRTRFCAWNYDLVWENS